MILLMEENLEQIYNYAIRWIKEAGELIKKEMEEDYIVSTKTNVHDLVTDVDRDVEKFFSERLKVNFPSHQLMGEEGSFQSVRNLNGVVWILDPIDGTINFVHQQRFFAISLGIFVEGEGKIGLVYDVMNDELFSARKGHGAYLNGLPLSLLPKTTPFHESIIGMNTGWILKDERLNHLVREVRGIRSYGAAALEIAYVAANRLDAYISLHLSPWDIAGGTIILEEVGGITSTIKGKELTFLQGDSIVAASPAMYDKLMEKLK